MRKLLQKILAGTVSRISEKYTSRPDKTRVHEALTKLYTRISSGNEKKGLIINMNSPGKRFIVFSDQHKGAKNGADDFAVCEQNYLAALEYYNSQDFHFISLGDNEELWENSISAIKKANVASFEKEKLFLQRGAFTKVFGNHDLDWGNSLFAANELQSIYGLKVEIYEGVIIRTAAGSIEIFLTHGHQGDELSDGSWFSKWFVAKVWAPLQMYLAINPNTPAYEDHLKTSHNLFMYEWVAGHENRILITGHTHQPVFQSLTHLENLYHKLNLAKKAGDQPGITQIEEQINKLKIKGAMLPDFTAYKPNYFNTGCCCFNDGDITGIEIGDNKIILVKWEYGADKKQQPRRIVLDEADLRLITSS